MIFAENTMRSLAVVAFLAVANERKGSRRRTFCNWGSSSPRKSPKPTRTAYSAIWTCAAQELLVRLLHEQQNKEEIASFQKVVRADCKNMRYLLPIARVNSRQCRSLREEPRPGMGHHDLGIQEVFTPLVPCDLHTGDHFVVMNTWHILVR